MVAPGAGARGARKRRAPPDSVVGHDACAARPGPDVFLPDDAALGSVAADVAFRLEARPAAGPLGESRDSGLPDRDTDPDLQRRAALARGRQLPVHARWRQPGRYSGSARRLAPGGDGRGAQQGRHCAYSVRRQESGIVVRPRDAAVLRPIRGRAQARRAYHPRSEQADGGDEDPVCDPRPRCRDRRVPPALFPARLHLLARNLARPHRGGAHGHGRLGIATMSASPLITVGLPVYNTERYLRQSIDSLLAQTYRDFVLVISDNASVDGTAKICQEYAAADPRVRYFRNEVNIGNPRNFNRIVELTTTPYLKWSTADDYWAPTFLERALEVMERDPSLALCYPQATLVDAEGKNPVEYDDVMHLMQEDPADRFLLVISKIKLAHQHLGLIRMADLKRTHLLRLHVSSDINLLAELSLYGKFSELPQRLFFRRFHKESG